MNLSPTDISVEILVMLIWWIAMYRSIISILYNDIPLRWKMYLGLFTIVGAIFTVQTVLQFLSGMSAIIWLWDILNAVVVFIAITMSTVLYDKALERSKETLKTLP